MALTIALVSCYVLLLCQFTNIKAEDDAILSGYESLGCWSMSSKSILIPSVEKSSDDDLDSAYWDRVQPVLKCAWAAKNLGYEVFAVRSGGECLTSASALKVYQQNGQSKECYGGEGGHEAMNVYRLKGTLPEVEEFEGDIILSKVQQAMTTPVHYYGDGVAVKSVWKKADYEWPDRVVPYFIPPRLKNHQLAQKMLAGLRHWDEQTCVKFVPKKDHRDWVELVREKNPLSRRCASAIGHNGRKQQMRLGDWCPAGSVIHEWGHSVGLWHTQSRPDRNDYIKILWKHIVPGMSSQFKIYSHGTEDTYDNVKYDYKSIMHYGKDFFGKISKDKSRVLTTIKTKDPHYQDTIGQRSHLSKGDVLLVNTMYGCPDFPFMWRTKEWSGCSKDCGTGTQKRKIYCAKKNGKKVSSKKCKNTKAPEIKRQCYGRKCLKCPDGWHKFKRACYLLDRTRRSWKKAKNACLDKGAELLTIRDKKEENELRKYIKSKYLQTLYFWIGAFYNSSEGSFTWSDGTVLPFHPWREGEPRLGMDCAMMMNHEFWGTDRCGNRRCSFCKKELIGYKIPVVKENNQSEHKWYTKEWSECSVTCGGGQRHRETYCARKNESKHVHYSKCKDAPPDAWKNCNPELCPSPYKWYVEEWKKCSVTCGGGYRRREIICATEAKLATAWEMCNHTKMPLYQKKCNTQPCPTVAMSIPEWKTSDWTHCSVSCGTGRQIRHVMCAAGKSGKRLHISRCSAQLRPAMARLCSAGKKCRKKTVIKKEYCLNKHVMCHIWRRQHLCGHSHVRRSCRRSCGACKV